MSSEISKVKAALAEVQARLAGLAQAGNNVECADRAAVFIAEVCEHNPILLGRGLLWRGAHSTPQATPARATLQQALDNELLYGGRDTWLGYYALGRASDDPARATEYYQNAATILNTLATSLEVQPGLSTALINDDFVQVVFGHASNKV